METMGSGETLYFGPDVIAVFHCYRLQAVTTVVHAADVLTCSDQISFVGFGVSGSFNGLHLVIL